MAITLALQKPDGEFCQTPYALMDEEVATYLGTLSQFSGLRSLADLDPYGELELPRSLRNRLLVEARDLEVLASKEQLPEPPPYVGLEGTGDPRVGKPFGWKGLVAFAADLRRVLEAASSQKVEVMAVGD